MKLRDDKDLSVGVGLVLAEKDGNSFAEEVKEYEDFMKISEGILKEAKKDFIKLNKINERQTLIQKTHRDRMNQKKEQNLLGN